jgi:hypothetical protein
VEKTCFYKTRKICPIRNCQRQYTGICRNNDGIRYTEEEIPDIPYAGMEKILKKEDEKTK